MESADLDEWLFPEAHVVVLPRTHSDHNPILIDSEGGLFNLCLMPLCFLIMQPCLNVAVGENDTKGLKTPRRSEGEGPTTAETTDPLLVPSRLLRVREAWNPQYEGSIKIDKGGQGLPQEPPPSSRAR
uniref:Uncharacterized protein n=1 Tax=Kalanchoe fedtschenkoi TaxID=63787 RepID=A0A7N0RAR3_KALFE